MSNHQPWHYAAAKVKGQTPVCPPQSMYCYFLNITNCEPQNDRAFAGAYDRTTRKDEEFFEGGNHPDLANPEVQHFIDFATRQKTWVRKAVYDFAKKVPLESPCSVIHVRRSDVVLHYEHSRRYHAIEEYMNASQQQQHNNNNHNHNNDDDDDDNDDNNNDNPPRRHPLKLESTILLLTDDANAIEEAKTKYPHINWVFWDRPRFKGAEGGWENQIPSDDPKLEMIALLTIF